MMGKGTADPLVISRLLLGPELNIPYTLRTTAFDWWVRQLRDCPRVYNVSTASCKRGKKISVEARAKMAV